MSPSVRVVGIPEAQARPRIFHAHGRTIAHSPKSNWFQVVYYEALAKRPPVPMDGPIVLSVTFYFQKPKSAKAGAIFKSTKPDLDNLLKAIKDALTQAHWWTDDGRVARVLMEKKFAVPPEATGAAIMAAEICK